MPLDLRILELVGLGELGLVGEDVRPLRLTRRPLGTDLGDALHVEAGVDQRQVQLLGVSGVGGVAVVVDALDVQLGVVLLTLVEERLADGQASGVCLGAQPVAGMLPLRDDQLERAVGLDVHLLLVHRGAGAGTAAAEAAPRRTG